MKCMMLFLALVLCFGTARAQNEWVLQPYVEIFGTRSGQKLGIDVSRTGDLNRDGTLDLSASDLTVTGIYDTAALRAKIPHLKFKGVMLRNGDFNGDGFTDVVVKKWVLYTDTLQLYFGSVAGIDTIPDLIIPGKQMYENFGEMTVGDVNGDGFDDLIVTTPDYPFPDSRGKVYVYLGAAQMDTIPDFTDVGDTVRSMFGTDCAAGDLNGDGYDDIAVLGADFQGGHANYHYIRIYFGASDFDLVPDLEMDDRYLARESYNTWGDLKIFDANGDGAQDLLIGGRDRLIRKGWEAVFIYYGSRHFDTGVDFELTDPDTNLVGISGFGETIANAGDMNGDGYDDILVGAPGSFQNCGFVFVYSAGRALDNRFDAGKGQVAVGSFGLAINGVGDINGDGLSEIIIGAPQYSFFFNQGYFGIFLGDRSISAAPPEKPKQLPPNDFELFQNYPNPFNGYTVIGYSLKVEALVKLTIFDVLGREVRVLVNQKQTSGHYQVQWDGKNNQGGDVPTGKYLYQLKAYGFSEVKEMTLVR